MERTENERNEFVQLLRLLIINSSDYELFLPNIILGRALIKTPGKPVEETLFTFNSFRVTYGVSYQNDDILVITYRLYQNDKELVKTDYYCFDMDEIELDDNDDIPCASFTNSKYNCFIGEIICKCVGHLNIDMDVKCWPDLGDILFSGQKKMADKMAERLRDTSHLGRPHTITLGKGVKVKVSYDMSDWDHLNQEGVVKIRYELIIDDNPLGRGDCDAFLCYPGGQSMEPDTIRAYSDDAYYDMMGNMVSGLYDDYLWIW